MIKLCKSEDCVGCYACFQVCPKKCIVMREDHEGFLYPEIDLNLCIDCHLCEKVCLVIHQKIERKPLSVYAAKNKDEEIRKESSSGGIFTLLAEQILDDGGVVFGARFDENWDVIHDYTETKTGLKAFRGSKYVQSRIGDNYAKAKLFLNEGRKVLFTGTPCQIAGLKCFLCKEYENLLTVDFVCHGVPSPKVWRLYRNEFINNVDKKPVLSMLKPSFLDIQFRSKQSGWKKYSFAAFIRIEDKNTILRVEQFSENLYMKGFLANLYLRPSCHACPTKNFKSGSDVTLGDFWGIENYFPEFDDDKGCSLVIGNSTKGDEFLNSIDKKIHIKETSYNIAIEHNSCIEFSPQPHPNRAKYFNCLNSNMSFSCINSLIKPNHKLIIKIFIYRLIKKLGLIK